jgi:hypothetical protein
VSEPDWLPAVSADEIDVSVSIDSGIKGNPLAVRRPGGRTEIPLPE